MQYNRKDADKVDGVKMKEKFQNLNKRTKLGIIGIIAGCLLIVGVLLIIGIKYVQYKEELRQKTIEMNNLVEQVTIIEETVSEIDTEKKSPLHDFVELREINEDIYAWINIDGTQVDYPVLQSLTDNKYLDTNLDGSSGYPGCIYSNVCNSKEFDDYITILYGHNMKSGEMFGSLHNFEDEDFFQNTETFTVETEEASFIYRVYASVLYNDKLIPAYYDVKCSSGRDAFLESLEEYRGNSSTHFRDEMEISGEDKVLVLSVCVGGQENKRYLIVSKLEEKIPYSK